LTEVASKNGITPGQIGGIIWRQRLVAGLAFIVILVIGSTVVLTRPTVYQSNSSVALLPASKNPGILSNYPNLVTTLVPTYVELVSSPTLLNRVATQMPFHTSGTQLAADVHAESLSNAAIINIVAEGQSPAQAEKIASAATGVFLARVRGNGVVVPRIFGQPAAAHPAPPGKALLLAVVLLLAIVLGAATGLIWNRFVGPPPWSVPGLDALRASGLPGRPSEPGRATRPSGHAAVTASQLARPAGISDSLDTVKLRPPSGEDSGTDVSGQASEPRGQ
jgi:capsular polysaccharide biosynthesis protein